MHNQGASVVLKNLEAADLNVQKNCVEGLFCGCEQRGSTSTTSHCKTHGAQHMQPLSLRADLLK